MSDVTALLDQWNDGDPEALKKVLALLYPELRRLADDLLRRERVGHTLQPTALVHEAYIRLTGLREMRLESRRHFYGAAASAMRRILVDHARQRRAQKRGGPDLGRASIDEALNAPVDLRIDFERLDEALEELAAFAPEKARIVELRYFAGLSIQETAALLDVAPATVKRHWTFARAWLHRSLTE
ncbi:MAG TPA: sigma-70 family RNA polymerase sigma factor [Vicinamibacterales bacterium]|jgi:RNA polymerase sigma factor (TIGR02999 family)